MAEQIARQEDGAKNLMPYPPLIQRSNQARSVGRRDDIPPRHDRIMRRIDELNVTCESVVSRAGYSFTTLDDIRAGRVKRDCILTDFEIALDLPKWEGRHT